MPTDPADIPKIITVADGFWVRQAVDNIAWIDLGDWALVVDALAQPQLEAEVVEAIRSTLGDRPVRYVLNTHSHGDHTALNAAFRRRFGAEVVSRRSGPMPAEGRWFEGPRRRVLMQPIPGAHSSDDCCIWVEDDRALFTGDLFGWGMIPTMRLDGDAADRLKAIYERLIGFDAATVIPGHGPLCTTAELRRWVEYFDWLLQQAARACAAGRTERQVVQDLAPPEDMASWWRFLAWKHEDNVGKVLSAVRAGRLKGGDS